MYQTPLYFLGLENSTEKKKKNSQCEIQNAHRVLKKGRNPPSRATLATTEAVPVQLSLQPAAHLSVQEEEALIFEP